MGFAMRMPLNEEIIKKKSIRELFINSRKNGLEFQLQLAYYRGHYLSDIDLLEVYIDGERIRDEAVTFELSGKEMPLYKLKHAVTEFWSQVQPAKIRILKPDGLTKGTHVLEVKLLLRIPYMEIGADHSFMPLDSGDKVEFTIAE